MIRLGAARVGGRRIASRIAVAAAARRQKGAALGYFGARQIVRKPRRGKKKVEVKRIDMSLASYAQGIAFRPSGAATPFGELQPGHMITSFTPAGPTWNVTNGSPIQGTGAGERVGDRIYVKQNQMRVCIEKGSTQAEAICCRLIVLQVTESTNHGAGTFTWGDFLQGDNITAFYKRDCTWKYKVLVDKTFTTGVNDDNMTDRRLTMNFPMGTASFKGGLTAGSLCIGPGDRVIYGFFCEPTGGDVTTYPQYHGSYKFTFSDS